MQQGRRYSNHGMAPIGQLLLITGTLISTQILIYRQREGKNTYEHGHIMVRRGVKGVDWHFSLVREKW